MEPETGLFTAVTVAKAAGEDNHEAVIGLDLLAGEEPGLQVLGDSAYGTGTLRAELAELDRAHTAVIKPPPLRPAIPGGFSIDDFVVDEPNGQVTCPGGHTRRTRKTRSSR